MISSQRVAGGHLLFLPLCPSTNRRTTPIPRGRICMEILTQETRDYLRVVGMNLKIWKRRTGFKAIEYYRVVDLWFLLPPRADCHNYLKVLFDTIEDSGIVTNDKFLIPRIQGIQYHKPGEVIIKL